MTYIRQDTLAGHWVIISEGRASRPMGVQAPRMEKQKGWLCPFCEGNESTTPEEVEALRPENSAENTPGWDIRVVPNRFEALSPKAISTTSNRGVLEEMGGFGHHEVIVETPVHDAEISDYTDSKLTRVLRTYQSRIRAQFEDKRIAYVQLFRNEGYMAGASLEHPHAQVLALPFVPPHTRTIVERSLQHTQGKRGCLTCALIEQELKEDDRVILDEDGFRVLTPFASRVPGEIALFPRKHLHRFEDAPEKEIEGLARVLRKSIWALKKTFDTPPFNLLIITSPAAVKGEFSDRQLKDGFHWHVQLIPRTTRFAGLEWGTGVSLNPLPPESAARLLRQTLSKSRIPAGTIKR